MACTRLPLLASECHHASCIAQVQRQNINKPGPSSGSVQASIVAGQKRKESDDMSVTLDPRKRPRAPSPEEQHVVVLQARISDLERQLRAIEQANTRHNATAAEDRTVQTCLEDLMKSAAADRELVRTLETNAELKAQAVTSATIALQDRTQQLSAAHANIRKLTARINYLEDDRKTLRANVTHYREKCGKIQTHYEAESAELKRSSRSNETIRRF
ncbi:hypothetical protein R3P38DRAFT_2825443 [Favolaschia claudopus]|uniref:Uncharacterized protein n=1 Tax=Favolaschia claudopus TaxID=2862362 RepID=A0AAW0EIM4_9AGAR